jgi:hypothetical protein
MLNQVQNNFISIFQNKYISSSPEKGDQVGKDVEEVVEGDLVYILKLSPWHQNTSDKG